MSSAEDAIVIQAWHILFVVLVPVLGLAGVLWRTWVKPAADERVRDAQWRDKTDRDITELRTRLDRNEQEDRNRFADHERDYGSLAIKLDEVNQCLLEIKLKLARIDERMAVEAKHADARG